MRNFKKKVLELNNNLKDGVKKDLEVVKAERIKHA